MTPAGTFVVNGIERAVVNQLVRSAGVYFLGDVDAVTGRMLYFAEIRPSFRGSWLEFNISRNNVISVRIDRRRKFPVTTFLRAIGIGSNEEIQKLFASVDNGAEAFIENTFKKDPTHGSAEGAMEIYKKMRPGEPAVVETAIDYINDLFFNVRRYNLGKVGRYKINKRLKLSIPNEPENWVLRREDIIETIKYLIRLQKGDVDTYTDDIDHLANRRLRRVGELVGSVAVRVGLLRLERTVKERMSLLDPKTKVMPNQVINARPLISAVNEFFRTSQLSAILEQTNPLSEVDTLRKLSVMGVGGISRERASFSIRDINASQYSRICPIRSPEGPNIGLVTFMSLYARVDEYGFLLAPYRKLEKVGDKVKISKDIVYLAADDERDFKITHAEVGIDQNTFLTDRRVPVRFRGDFLEANTEDVNLIDVIPRQVVGTAAALIPYLQHDDGIRALMGSNMQSQAVPLVRPQSPVVGTGVETDVASSMGWVAKARHDGEAIFVDGNKIVLKISKPTREDEDEEEETDKIKINGNLETYLLTKFKKTDPNGTCYSQKPLVKVGQTVRKGDALIDGPAAEDGELALGTNLTIAYMHFEGYGYEDAIIVSDRLVKEDLLTSIHIEEYECEVVDTKLGPEELTRDIPNVGELDLANLDEGGIVVIGAEAGPNDILVGKIAPKGETELSAEERLLRAIFGEKAREVRDTSLRMPHGEHGTVIGITILDKEKGDELSPGTSKLIKVKVAQIRKVSVGDKVAGRHGNKGVISRIVASADMPHLEDGTPIDIMISPLSVLGRMNLGQLLETHLGWAMSHLGRKITVPVFEQIPEELLIDALKKAGLPSDGKAQVIDGRTGETFPERIVVGTGYILKLIHMVEDKTHARSTGPYSLVTQQPLGGKAQMGGQRLGEMEVWALEAHRAAYTLQEMLTIKSDDVVGRAKAFEAIVKGTDIPQSTIPESFKVLVKELQSLALSVQPLGIVTAQPLATTGSGSDQLEEKVQKEVKELEEILEAKTDSEDTPAHEASAAGENVISVKSDEEIKEEVNE
ncbi:DNA-directed RNA polymerase subunit beta [Candidatus Gottesmanbacteria bacterium RIFCSPHIGHO2_01_FULL_47_48]|uniref:DNA-directed RNA polymerase subunit beta n=1 Tax=Candidatus Gottesmanbacteria bacterium RIFCSPHIGHO2_01_FULL_47_48 TaxID=1798381 RepID=A0A1F6A0C6_9BACT|nr:MAG: DNA-directed RNA polymerase subunit beta [Candidatus Gottesmanbacteria bacterium RIFCSPHIGHO2_01_FULL_47_48]